MICKKCNKEMINEGCHPKYGVWIYYCVDCNKTQIGEMVIKF